MNCNRKGKTYRLIAEGELYITLKVFFLLLRCKDDIVCELASSLGDGTGIAKYVFSVVPNLINAPHIGGFNIWHISACVWVMEIV